MKLSYTKIGDYLLPNITIKNQNYGLNDCLILIFLQIYQKIFKAYLVNILYDQIIY